MRNMFNGRIFCILINLLPFLQVGAQNSSEQLIKVLPPSPNVASLGKYGDIPVSLYTGIPNISIPLYEIRNGSLTLPVSLTYHAAGVKVEEIASSVGIGWTLNAGGVVGRSVRGLPDEVGGWQQPVDKRVENIMLSGDYTRKTKLVNDVNEGIYDGEADLYYYNFNQNSGKFFHDQAGVPHTVPNKNIIIKPNSTGGWIVTTEDGTVYSFTKVEDVNSSDGTTTTTAWYLSSMKSSDGKREISFIYESVNYVYTSLIGETKYYSTNGSGSLCLQDPGVSLGSYQYRTQRLKKIDFGEGYVAFNYNNVRCDLVDDKSLDEVVIHRSSDEIIRRFKLNYSYFGSNLDGVNRLTEDTKRLKLVSITEEAPTNASLPYIFESNPPYSFEYNETVTLPRRLSYEQDHWGYFNGAINNPGLVSKFSTVSSSGSVIFFPGADRTTNPETSQAGVLTKITYPAGGETQFSYESNTVSDDKVEFKTTEQLLEFKATNQSITSFPRIYESGALIIPAPGAEVKYTVTGLESGSWANCDQVLCYLIKNDNPAPKLQFFTTLATGTTDYWEPGTYKVRLITTDCNADAIANFSVIIKAQVVIPEPVPKERAVGGLRIREIRTNPGGGGKILIKTYKYHKENDNEHSSGVLINYPDYGYDLAVESQISDESGSVHSTNYCNYRVRQSFSNYPLATTQGGFVGYEHVIEKQGTNGESRHTFVAYSNSLGQEFPFVPVENFDWRRGFEKNTKFIATENGQEKLIKEIDNGQVAGQEFRIYGIKTGSNYWVLRNGARQPNLQPPPTPKYYSTITEFTGLGKTTEITYDVSDQTRFTKTTTEYSYSPDHLQLIQTKTNTSRSNQTTEEEIVSNKKYPFDYKFTGTPSGSEALGIKKLQDLHVADAIVEVTVARQSRNLATNQLTDSRVIRSNLYTYKTDNPYPSQVFQLQIKAPVSLSTFGNGSGLDANSFINNSTATLANSYQPVANFNSYDEKGNVIEQQKTGDVIKTYLWGYNKNYPVAEVLGADYSTIRTFIDQGVLDNPTSTEDQIKAQLTNLRTALATKKALVSTYTYKPLTGTSTHTDANGKTTFYDYDLFGRLKSIKDQDGKIIKVYDYKIGQ